MADQEVAAVEDDESTSPAENLPLVEGGKKDHHVRRQELLVNSGLAEVARGGSHDILHPAFDDKLNTLHETIASLASESKSEGSEEELILINFHSSRTITKLVMDCPRFASTFWKNAWKGKCELWAQGHSCKVVSAFLDSSDTKVRDLAKKELNPLIDSGLLKIPEGKQPANEVQVA